MKLEKRIAELEEDNAKKDEANAKKDEIIAKQAALIEWYQTQFKLMKRRQFGASSEVTEPGFCQLTIFGEAAVAPPQPETIEVTVKRKKRVGKRAEDLANLPVVRTDYELPENEHENSRVETPSKVS